MENKEKFRSLAENVWAYIAAFLRWGVLGLLVGGLGGFVGALFAKSVAWATAMRGANPWLLYLLPVGGLAIVGVYKLCRVSGVGTNEVFEGVRSNKGVSILLAPAIFLTCSAAPRAARARRSKSAEAWRRSSASCSV